MPRKKKAAPKDKPAQSAAPTYVVAKCNWCGMQWKHFGDESPKHYCGKVCASHESIEEPQPVD